ncbi:MAG TPA: vWA domain-containing protein [Myxococcales bacterium]|jgi:hypothetical protein
MNRALSILVAALLGLLGCVKTLPAENYPCPCGDGWQCCPIANVCIAKGESCPTPSCIPDCSGGKCGPNECGTSCGACACNGKTCHEDEVCTPVKRCGIYVGATRPSKVMLVLDKSGSMKTLATSDTQWGCANDGSGNGYSPSGDCKWNTLKRLLADDGGFVDQAGTRARIGMAIFSDPSSSDSCAAGTVLVPVPDSPGASRAEMQSKLNSLTPSGGTPSAPTLRNVAADATFTKKEEATSNFVILITDGMPNCNSSLADCSECTNGGDPTRMCGDVRNCLDHDALIAAVKTLRAKEIFTLVIGFGSAFVNPGAKDVLNEAALAGGMPQNGADTMFYFASNTESLKAILDKIVPAIGTCLFSLDRAPVDPEKMEVLLTDSSLEPPVSESWVRGTDWEYADETHTTVAINGDKCLFIQTATEGRYQLSFQEKTPL